MKWRKRILKIWKTFRRSISKDFNLDGLDNLDDLGDLDLDNLGENLDDDDFDFEQFDKLSDDVSLI